MSINEVKNYFRREIIGCSISDKREEELLEKLESITDDLLDLEREIEDELEKKEEYEDNLDYQTAEEQDTEFLYANRVC